MIIRRLALAAMLAAVATAAHGQDSKLGSLQISQTWTRATPPSAPTGVGFMTITNKGATPDRLVAARSPTAGKVEIHEMKMDGNIMRMRELEKGLEIPPGSAVELKPGGFHIMFIGLKEPFAKDTRVPLTLTFERAGNIDVVLPVMALGAGSPAPKH